MTSAALRAPNLREVRRGLAETLRPVARLQAELVDAWPVEIDAGAARRRIRAGRPAFDAAEVLHHAGDLRRPFQRATQAFERAGLATAESALAARQQAHAGVVAIARSWIAGEPLSRLESRRLAQRAAAVVAGAFLSRVARAVGAGSRTASRDRSTCPACGSPPEFAVASPRGRRLICARCDTAWRTAHAGCVGCSAEEAPTVVRIPSARLGYELVVCNACGRYLKERVARGTADLLVERALTAQLDAAAERRGLRL